MDLFSLTAVSPIDGRYSAKTINLRELVSEYGLIKARVRVEAEWLSFLAIQAQLPEPLVFPCEIELLIQSQQRLHQCVDEFPRGET